MNYIEERFEGEVRIPIPIPERIKLIDQDVEELVVPENFPKATDIASLIHRIELIGNCLRRTRRDLTEKLEWWKNLSNRLQRAIGASNTLTYSDTGNKRKAIAALATDSWGPVNVLLPGGEQGLKRTLLPVERESAMQLSPLIVPGIEDIPTVELSYSDLLQAAELAMKQLEALEEDVQSKHFHINNLVKLIEVEGYERRAS